MKDQDLEEVSTERLLKELGRRRRKESKSLESIEEGLLVESRRMNLDITQGWLDEHSGAETDEPQPCPRCGKGVAVSARRRVRHVLTLHGELSYRRHSHYCRGCRHGFYPLDEALGLPASGHASRAMSRRLVDFGVNDTYEEGCARFLFHYGVSVSTCLLHDGMNRLTTPAYRAVEVKQDERLTVQVDGSMLSTREGWKEAKLGVIVRSDHHVPGNTTQRGVVTEASYIGTMQDIKGFEREMRAVLPKKVPRIARLHHPGLPKDPEVVWVGDGAPWVWTLQKRLCPQATPILDWMHAIQHATDCGTTQTFPGKFFVI